MSVNRRRQRGGHCTPVLKAALVALAAVAAFVAVAPSRAGDTWIAASVASYHFDRDAGHNERNWGLGIEQGIAPHTRLVAGAYRNSLYATSRYAGVNWTPFEFGPVHLGLMAGVVDGYNANRGRFIPVAVPMLALEQGRVGANLLYLPRYKDDAGVVGLQVKFRFD